MRAINFKKKAEPFTIVHKGNAHLDCWAFDIDTGMIKLHSPEVTYIDNDIYTATVEPEDRDYWWIMKWGHTVDIVMIGAAEVVCWLYTGIEDEEREFAQYALSDGRELKKELYTEAGDGFYYAEPVIEKSACVLSEHIMSTLTIPYIVINCETIKGGTMANGAYLDTGFATFGFLGNRHSYFDLGQGMWVNDETKDAKASDLAKAVCYKYGLDWDDKTSDKWIGKYIKYIRSYQESAKRFRLYIPSKTPESNVANFELVQTDEAGNHYVRGVSLLLTEALDKVNEVEGVLITFQEEES